MISLRRFTYPAIAGIGLAAAGCANVPREAGFETVRVDVAERTGGKRVLWNANTPADVDVARELRELIAGEVTADEAVQVALLNNRNLQATYESLMVAQADLVAAGLLSNPVFDAEVRFVEGGGGTGIELAIVQDFVDLFFIPLRKRLAGAAFDAAKLRVTGEAVALAGGVRSAYYELQAAQQTLELQRQIVDATSAAYELAQRLRAAGNNTELDLYNERALYEESKLSVRQAEASVTRMRERLNGLMGLWGEPSTAWTAVARLPDVPAEPPTADGLERQVIAKSLDLGVARQDVTIAAQSLGIAAPFGLGGGGSNSGSGGAGLGVGANNGLAGTFGVLADVEIGASAEREPDGEWAVGPAFSIPIPLFNQGQPAVASAVAELRAAYQRYAAMAIELRAEARTAYADLTDAHDRAVYYARVLLPLRQRIVDQTQLQYNAMQIGAFQLLQAKQMQIDAGERYIDTLREYWLARAALDQLLAGSRPAASARGKRGGEAPPMRGGSGEDH